jgi:ATP-binding cassette subfamily B protein
MNKSSVEAKGTVPRKDSVPDYDHLFDENTKSSGRRVKGFLGKIFGMNKGTMVMSSLIYVVQSAPLWIAPLITAGIINLVTEAFMSGGGLTPDVWKKLIMYAVVLFVSIVQNVPTTVWRLKMVNKMLRQTSAGIKTSVVKKLQGLSITYHKEMQTGKIQSKFLRDIENVDQLLSNIDYVLIMFISVVISVIVSVYKNGIVALFFLIVVPLKISITMFFTKKFDKII